MLMANFKVAGYKVFGEPVELNMMNRMPNAQHLLDNTISINHRNSTQSFLKTSLIYGSNNTGKSSLLDGIMVFKKIVNRGDLEGFPLDVYKNFSCQTDDCIKFEITFSNLKDMFTYGVEFENSENIGEYLFLDDLLLFSRDLENNFEGSLLAEPTFETTLKSFPTNKLISTYYNEYMPKSDITNKYFSNIKKMFNKIDVIYNNMKYDSSKEFISFFNDEKKMNLLNNTLINSNLYIEGMGFFTDAEVRKIKIISQLIDAVQKMGENSHQADDSVITLLKKYTSYKNKDGNIIELPSFIYDSLGTNKYVRLLVYIIDAILDEKILLIDEIDSSLHYILTRTLLNIMNLEVVTNSQFIITTHDVKLLNQELLRKDQINFVVRDENNDVDLISLDEFKSNSDRDIRHTSNYEKLYIEERIVSLPDVNIYNILMGFEKYGEKE